MSENQDQEYFSDGLSEELLNVLAKVEGLKVAVGPHRFSLKEIIRIYGKSVVN